MKAGLSTALGVMFLIVLSGCESVPPTKERAEFCEMQHYTCKVTCPSGSSASCLQVCEQRLSSCKESGCYHFNVPGPRCEPGAKAN